MEKYVIIGNGVAAASCIKGIRSVDKEGGITVISEEKHPVYCRPLISYLLEGKTDTEKMNYVKGDFYDEMGCKVLYSTRALKADGESKTVLLDSGESVPYTKLCFACGSSPFVPPFKGLESVEKKYSFMTLDDAIALGEATEKNSRVLIIGAGLIGLKCAEGIKDRVSKITVCDLADRVLSSILDESTAAVVQSHLEENGIDFMLSDSADSFEGNVAVMKSGRRVEFDILVLAVGVRANTALAKEMGANVGRGITVDEKMQTSVDGVWAAGDCTEGYDITFGAPRTLALLPNANFQGYTAGVNMAGGEAVFDNAIPMNSIGFFGLHLMTAGTSFTEAEGGSVYEEKDENRVKKLFMKDSLLTGFILIGATERAGIYTSMIRNRIPLDTLDFEMLKKSPTTAAFSSEKRRKMFGGVV